MRRNGLALEAISPSAPTQFRVWALGEIDTTKGTFTLSKESLARVIESAVDYGNRYTVDYEHAAVTGRPGEGISAGSFLVEARADGLWAVDVRWTLQAKAAIEAKKWLYFSPWFEVDNDGNITALLNIALTNTPATKRMQTLVAASKVTSMSEEEKQALIDAFWVAVKALTDAGIEVPAMDSPASAEAVSVAATARALFGGSDAKSVIAAMTKSFASAGSSSPSDVRARAEGILSGKRVDDAPRARLMALASADWQAFEATVSYLPMRSQATQMPVHSASVATATDKVADKIRANLKISKDSHAAAMDRLHVRLVNMREDKGDE